jgi:hypothetical protein
MINNQWLKDVLAFRYMLTSNLVLFVFWLGVAVCLITTVTDWYIGWFWQGLLVLIMGPLILRIVCELFIIFFQINNTLLTLARTKDQHRQSQS